MSLIRCRPLRLIAIAAIAFAPCAAPRPAAAAVTGVTVNIPDPVISLFCGTSRLRFAARVSGTPGQKFLWIVVYDRNGQTGNTGATPSYATIGHSGHANLSYVLTIPTPSRGYHQNYLQVNTQTIGASRANLNSAPKYFSFANCARQYNPPPTPTPIPFTHPIEPFDPRAKRP